MSKTVPFQLIQFCISTHFSPVWPIDRTLTGATTPGPEWIWERWQWWSTPHSLNLQHYWNLTNRLFSVISRTLIGGSFIPLQRSSQCVLQPQPTGQFIFVHAGSNAPSCLLQTMPQEFSLSRCICEKQEIFCVVCVRYSFCGISSAFCIFSNMKPFSFIITNDVHSTLSK